MANDSSENFVSNAAAGLLVAAVCAGFYYLFAFSFQGALLAALSFSTAAAIATFFFIFKYYLEVLGSGTKAKGSKSRQDYELLRDRLSRGGTPSVLYAERLTLFLNSVDVFLGDTGEPRPSIFAKILGLKNKAHLWTAASFDRCLLLALLYPVVTVFLVWAIFGHVGPAEDALGLQAGISSWRRLLASGALCLFLFACRRCLLASGKSQSVWLGCVVASFVCILSAGSNLVLLGAAVACLATVIALSFPVFANPFGAPSSGTGAASLVVGFAVALPQAVNLVDAHTLAASTVAFLLGIVAAIFFAFLTTLAERSFARRGRQGVFLFGFVVIAIIVCMLSNGLVTWGRNGGIFSGPLLLFLGLLTFLNAPFDWLSLGLTRALLRRGIELGAWTPYGLALLDAAIAAMVIALLTCTMVIGIRLFGLVEIESHVQVTLPVLPLLDGIAVNPGAPEYFWVYALLLSTMIPSVANLTIGGASLLSGIPGVTTLLLQHIPVNRSVPVIHRSWVAFALTTQWFVGGMFAVMAQALLVWAIFGWILPHLEWSLLEMARWVAALELP